MGGAIVARAIEETLAGARAGMTELALISDLYRRIREQGLDIVSAMCASDERIYNYRHPVPTDKVIKERIQMGGNMRYKGLIICCTRFMNLVPVSEDLRKQYLANVEIDCTFAINSKIGQTYVSALEAGRQAYIDRGYGEEFNKHHQGGPIGYVARDYRVDFETPGLIQENQAFCWNPSISGTKSEDTLIVTEKGIIPATRPIICPSIDVEIGGQTFRKADIWQGC